ncbi:MAG: hypothetical protein GY847_09580 [Proteobacteria bacterium]|nr:hypothetical protein [Pseudomonadota bacterium]
MITYSAKLQVGVGKFCGILGLAVGCGAISFSLFNFNSIDGLDYLKGGLLILILGLACLMYAIFYNVEIELMHNKMVHRKKLVGKIEETEILYSDIKFVEMADFPTKFFINMNNGNKFKVKSGICRMEGPSLDEYPDEIPGSWKLWQGHLFLLKYEIEKKVEGVKSHNQEV